MPNGRVLVGQLVQKGIQNPMTDLIMAGAPAPEYS